MVKWIGSRYFWGGLIIIAGVILLLQSLNIIEFGSLFLSILFVFGGVIFLSVFASSRDNWWAIIPGMTLLSLALIIALDYFAPEVSDNWAGTIIMFGIGSSFVPIYLFDHQNWWAIIPGGVLLSIGIIIGLEPYVPETVFIGLFFLGIGMTFGVLSLVTTPQGRMNWALIPAGILGLIGLVMMLFSGDVFRIVGAVALILVGIYFIYRTVRTG